MLRLARLWRPHKNAPTIVSSNVSPNTTLILRLEQEHERLLNQLSNVCLHAEQGKYRQVGNGLNEFRKQLTEHLLTENTQLYVNLNQRHRNSPYQYSQLQQMRRQSTGLIRKASKSLEHWQQRTLNDHTRPDLLDDIEQSQELLQQNFDFEQKVIFPLLLEQAEPAPLLN